MCCGAAMALLHAGVDLSVIALWLGHESTQSSKPTYTRCRIRISAISTRSRAFRPGRRELGRRRRSGHWARPFPTCGSSSGPGSRPFVRSPGPSSRCAAATCWQSLREVAWACLGDSHDAAARHAAVNPSGLVPLILTTVAASRCSPWEGSLPSSCGWGSGHSAALRYNISTWAFAVSSPSCASPWCRPRGRRHQRSAFSRLTLPPPARGSAPLWRRR